MHQRFTLLLCALAGLWPLSAAETTAPDLSRKEVSTERAVDVGPHHALIEYVFEGKTNLYTSLATCMHYWSEAEARWLPSEARIESDEQGPYAARGPLRVRFPSTLRSPSSLVIETPSGNRLSGHVSAIAYFDAVSGERRWIGVVRESTPNLQIPSQVTYERSVEGLDADVRFRYTQASLEQDVVFFQAPPPPNSMGLPDESTRIQIWTEWTEAAVPIIQTVLLAEEPDPAKRAAMVEPDWEDQLLELGDVRFAAGSAFAEPGEGIQGSIAVGKQWYRDEATGRSFLIESIPYLLIKEQFQKLPQQAAMKPSRWKDVASKLPPPASRASASLEDGAQIARSDPKSPRVVADWKIIFGSMSGFRFESASTYLITNTFYLTGTNWVEGNSVTKLSGASAVIDAQGTLLFETDTYRPAHFTSRNENSLGETVSGSTGSPQKGDYHTALYVSSMASPSIQNARIRYGTYAIRTYVTSLEVRHTQISRCGTAFHVYPTMEIRLRNVLANDFDNLVTTTFGSGTVHMDAQQCTFDVGTAFMVPTLGTRTYTNCVFSQVPVPSPLGAGSVQNDTTYSAFSTALGGKRYIGNPFYWGKATTNIEPALLTELGTRTVKPPVMLLASDLNEGVI